MNITYDKEADALYIQLKESPVSESLEVADGVIIDLDVDKKIIGIEIIYVSSRITPEELSRINIQNLPLTISAAQSI